MPPTPGPDASDIGAGAAIQTPEPHAGAATAQKTAPQDMSGDREAFQMVIGEWGLEGLEGLRLQGRPWPNHPAATPIRGPCSGPLPSLCLLKRSVEQ